MNFNVEEPIKLITDKLEGWVSGFLAMLPNLAIAVVIFVLFLVAARFVRRGASSLFSKLSDNQAVVSLFSTIVYMVVVVTGLFIALGLLNLDKTVTTLLTGVGIVGLALGFAFQDIAANFISGIMIAFRQPFKVGDIIESQGYLGKVKEINLRTTTINTFQGLDVLIPNKNLFQDIVINYTGTKDRRVDLAVGVSYGDDLEKVKKITIDTVSQLDSIDSSRDVTLFYNEFGGSSINFSVRFWAKSAQQPDYLRAQSDAIIAIQKVYDENDIMIPFPIRTLDFGIKGGEKLSEMVINHQKGGENS